MPNHTYKDATAALEEQVLREEKPRLSHLIRLFIFAFSSTKVISTIYLGAFILLSLLRPALAFLWREYIETAQTAFSSKEALAPVLLLLSYFLINFLADLITRYVYLYDDIEQLNLVQANRQQEKLHSIFYRKIAAFSPELLEIPKIQDRIDQVYTFVAGRFEMNTAVMLQCYCMIAKCVSVLSIAASLFVFDPWLCLILLLAPLPTVWSNTAGSKMRFEFLKNNTQLLRKAEYFENLMLSGAAKEIRILSLHDFFYGKWKAAADAYTEKEQALIRKQAKFLILHNLIIQMTILAGSVFAVLRMITGHLSLGELAAVLLLVSTLVGDMKEMLMGFATFITRKNEAAQFFDLMNLAEEKRETSSASGAVELKGVRYRYPLTDKYVIDGVDLAIHPGEKVAFVGENGAGKTTLVKLILGLLAPSSGEIRVDGKTADSLCGGYSVVMQNPAKYYTFTAADNVFLGDTARPRDEKRVDEALNFAGLSHIERDTVLGRELSGMELSGGEWQKLAIARAAYRDRSFYILDEPTSSLDPLAEAEIFQKYLELSRDKTVIFVTHRISVASLADRIVVFDGGKIVEDGTHQTLLRQGGKYAALYTAQSRLYSQHG